MGTYQISNLERRWAETVAGRRLTDAEVAEIVTEYNDYLDRQDRQLAEMECIKHAYDF